MSSVASHPDRSFPRLHPRPARGWLNDPNGIHFADGRWHVFFQHNPASARHEDIAWGHVSSADLLRWEDHGVALQPQPGAADSFGCWTGVGLVDDGVATLLYSGVRALDGRSSVMLARAEGDGWAQSPHVAVGMPDDDAMLHVRDPFVFTLGGRRWGIQGAGTKAGAPLILLYDATDLRSWEYQGILLDGTDPVAAGLPPSTVWECPQLVRVGDDWVLIASLWLNGVTTDVVSLVGSLEADDATGLPRFVPRAAGLLDDGPSFYAPQAVQAGGGEDPERILLWGWARELAPDGVRARSQADADAVGWSGTLTSPLELVVVGDRTFTVPARELTALRGEPIVDAIPDQAELLLAGTGQVELWLAADGEPGQRLYSSELAGGALRILIDASLVEVFPDGGTSTTLRAYPADGESYRLVVGPDVTVQGWELRLLD